VVFGAICRVRQYAANTSLWHDESFVALNIIDTSLAGILGPLDWHEPSPPGFLALEKLVAAVLGPSEYALRAAPLLAGLAALVAFAWLARRVCSGEAAAALAVVLFAASGKLITDASQVKHFTLDVLIAVVLSGLTWRIGRDSAPRPSLLWWWGALAAVGPWFSYAAIFGSAATSLLLAAPAVHRWPLASRRAYLRANLLVLVSAAALLLPVTAQRGGPVVQFWSRAFPAVAGPLPFVIWLGRSLIALFDYFWQPFGGLLLVSAALAIAACRRTERRPLLRLLWLPVGLALLAAALHWWPFGGNQHMVFAAPAVLVFAADGIELARRRLAGRRPRLAWAALALLLAPGLLGALYHLIVPRQRHELRPVIAYVEQQSRPGDQLAVFDPATFKFYTGRDMRSAPLPLASPERVWVITPRAKNGDLHPEVRSVVDRLGRTRPRLRAMETYGAAAYLFGATGDGVGDSPGAAAPRGGGQTP
jgi:hypothetical protein